MQLLPLGGITGSFLAPIRQRGPTLRIDPILDVCQSDSSLTPRQAGACAGGAGDDTATKPHAARRGVRGHEQARRRSVGLGRPKDLSAGIGAWWGVARGGVVGRKCFHRAARTPAPRVARVGDPPRAHSGPTSPSSVWRSSPGEDSRPRDEAVVRHCPGTARARRVRPTHLQSFLLLSAW